ncbi:MAG: PRD domain-containing protein [Erysipelotrichaceae bacterium]|nr:PRD domain-containing protein [Erysipelotrichaceae bacterium]
MLVERINILQEANIISKEVGDYVLKVIDLFDEYQFDESKMEMFTTHLAMATQRTVDQSEEIEFDESIWSQIEIDSKFEQAVNLFEMISKHSPVPYMESERKFLIMHLCNLSQD